MTPAGLYAAAAQLSQQHRRLPAPRAGEGAGYSAERANRGAVLLRCLCDPLAAPVRAALGVDLDELARALLVYGLSWEGHQGVRAMETGVDVCQRLAEAGGALAMQEVNRAVQRVAAQPQPGAAERRLLQDYKDLQSEEPLAPARPRPRGGAELAHIEAQRLLLETMAKVRAGEPVDDQILREAAEIYDRAQD